MSYIGTTRTTHVRHGGARSEEILRALQLQHEAMRTKARLLAEGLLEEPSNAGLRIRLQPTLLELYQKAPEEVKAIARSAMKAALQAVLLSYWLEGYAPRQNQAQPVIINLNVNQNNNEIKPTININIKQADVEYLERLISDLVTLLESKLDARTARVVRSRVARAERILEELRKGVN